MDKRNKNKKFELRLQEEDLEMLDKGAVEKGYFLDKKTAKKPNRSRYLRALIAAGNNPALSEIDLVQLRKEFANLGRVFFLTILRN